MPPSAAIGVEYATAVESLPGASAVRRWTRAALRAEGVAGGIAIRVMDEPEMAALNERFRGKPGPTNVLSFPPGESPAGADHLGDIAICAPVIEREAHAQGKSVEAHFAHLVIHGVLHLLGYDHESEEGAKVMEVKEAAILAGFGIDDPYVAEQMGRSRDG